MPNIIPPIVSSSPPPLDPIEDDDDNDEENDDFGDFTTADFASHNDIDSSTHKSISDTSWTLSSSKPSLNQSEIHENGVIPLMTSSEDGFPKSQVEGVDDDEISQNADNTSHDSVVSAVTDSGHGSASQNSSGTSPMPNVEMEFETTVKSSVCHSHQNGTEGQLSSEIPSSSSVISSCAISDSNQNPSNEDDTQELKDTTIQLSNNTSVADFPQQNSCESGTASNLISTENSEDEVIGGLVASDILKSEAQSIQKSNNEDSISTAENDQMNGEPSIASMGTLHDDLNPNEVGALISKEPVDMVVKEKGSEYEWNDVQFTTSSSSCNAVQDVLPDTLKEPEENECVRAMIIPEMPGSDYDDNDDDFGDFSGITSSSSQNAGETCKEVLFDSPSRRPTLVLTDDTEDSDKVIESALTEAMNTFSEPSRKNSSVTMEENDTSSFSFKQSNAEDPTEDEFADFAQAEDVNKDSVSDVWAQAAQASAYESTLQPVDSSGFDDFDDFESAEFQSVNASKVEPSPKSLFDPKEMQCSLDKLLKENFPVADGGCSFSDMDSISNGLSGIALDVEESSIWQGLRDMEATPSLSFQWPGSHSNRGLLGALNIDSRNILFGPKWNTVVPRFAANLGFSPLEPVRAVQNQPPSEPSTRTEIIQPQPEENVKTSPSDKGEMVPAAQFDWSDSGLINPLDSNKDPINGPLATTAASGNPVLTSTPLQVEQLLANSKRSTPVVPLDKQGRDPSLSPEAVRVLDTLPELAFLSARMLMFPVQGDRNENKL